MKMASIVYDLVTGGRSLFLPDILEEYEISDRTARRYFKTLNELFEMKVGQPLIRSTKEGSFEYWRIVDEGSLRSTEYNLLSLYMGCILLSFLEGTVIQDGLFDLFYQVEQTIPKNKRSLLKNHHKKFVYTSFGHKEYFAHDDQIDVIIRSLILQRPFSFLHESTKGMIKRKMNPFSMIFHKGALYIYGYSYSHDECRLFKVDKIRSAKILVNEEFDYPKDYSPQNVTSSTFGIYQGEKKQMYEVIIEFEENLYDYIAMRQWSCSQRVIDMENGKYHFCVEVDDLNEIFHWTLALGSQVKALGPIELVEMIRDEIDAFNAIYNP